VSLLFLSNLLGAPSVAHWGKELNDADVEGLLATSTPAVMNSSFDVPRRFSILAGRGEGWSGAPVLEIVQHDRVLDDLTLVQVATDGPQAVFTIRDTAECAEVVATYRLDAAGVLHAETMVKNISKDTRLDVDVARVMLPLPLRASEVVDFTGRWTREHQPQRSSIRDGTWARTSRRGRPGHDSSFLTLAGTTGFGFRHGEIWATHVAWSGNQEVIVERLPEGAGVHASVMGGGEVLDTGEGHLAPGQVYTSPTVMFAWSDEGMDGVTARLHASIRSRPNHPKTPRPLILNTWEAVYFDQGFDRLATLAATAADAGVERFVLDDGWFRNRRDDTAGLGDWYVDVDLWPEGLRPLSDRVHELGMEFGLWFEPEMVNPDSELAREHPDWILGESALLTWRNQFVLDFSRDDVAEYILERLDRVLTESQVDFVKWDHNRDLHAARGEGGSRRVRDHTLAVYRVLDELRRRHPALEIESCASGGARADLGILQHTDRVWASDCNDPIERQFIQRWTQTLLPPELIGAHVGAATAHTTERHSAFAFRAITALFGHAGLELDLTRSSPDEASAIAAWSALYRELRELLHSGITVRGDHVDPGTLLHGIVDAAGNEAVFAWIRTGTSATAYTPRIPIPGLSPSTTYRVRVRTELGAVSHHQVANPGWMTAETDLLCTGAVLAEGLPLPVLNPGQGMLLHLTAQG